MWDVVGHERALDFLRRSIEGNALPHSLLFVGPRHVGKTTLALNLAQALNCPNPDAPCGACSACNRIKKGVFPDVRLVEPRNREISIEQIREIQREAGLKPFEGRFRVFIISEAESLSPEAANSLLKILEEPPPQVVFVLLAESEENLLPTVLSRCQKFDLLPLPLNEVEEALVRRWEAPPQKASLLARLSRGRIGWAVSALQDEEILRRREREIGRILEVMRGGFWDRFDYASDLSNLFSKEREGALEILELWEVLWEDLLRIKGGCPQHIINIDLEEELAREASRLSLPEIAGFIEALNEAYKALLQNANPRLVFENLMLRIPEARGRCRSR